MSADDLDSAGNIVRGGPNDIGPDAQTFLPRNRQKPRNAADTAIRNFQLQKNTF